MCGDYLSYFTHLISKYIYTVAHLILIIFIIISMILISIAGLPNSNIILYLILFFLTIILTILGGVFICYSKRQDPELKQRIKRLIDLAIILTLSLLVLTIVEEIIISGDFSKKEKKVKDNCNYDEEDSLEFLKKCTKYLFLQDVENYTYFKLTYIEIVSLISILYWLTNRKKNDELQISQINQINTPLNPAIPVSYNINATNNNVYMVNPPQQYNSNYLYVYNPVQYNQGQQYVQNNNIVGQNNINPVYTSN